MYSLELVHLSTILMLFSIDGTISQREGYQDFCLDDIAEPSVDKLF